MLILLPLTCTGFRYFFDITSSEENRGCTYICRRNIYFMPSFVLYFYVFKRIYSVHHLLNYIFNIKICNTILSKMCVMYTVLFISYSFCFSLDSRHSSGLGRFVQRKDTEGNTHRVVMLHRGIPRICLFAKQDIDAGEELIISIRDDVVSKSHFLNVSLTIVLLKPPPPFTQIGIVAPLF